MDILVISRLSIILFKSPGVLNEQLKQYPLIFRAHYLETYGNPHRNGHVHMLYVLYHPKQYAVFLTA